MHIKEFVAFKTSINNSFSPHSGNIYKSTPGQWQQQQIQTSSVAAFASPNLKLSVCNLSPFCFDRVKSLTHRSSAASMAAPTSDHTLTSQEDAVLRPELLTEFMVYMNSEGCVNAVKNKLQTVNGVRKVEVDLGNQVVRVLGSSPVKIMSEALEQTGRTARLIGQGVPEDFSVSSAVAEFKGPDIFGVVQFAQVNMELARVEASFSGLAPGKHCWSINEFGDLTRGAASTGKVYNPLNPGTENQPLGNLGTFEAYAEGNASFSGTKQKLKLAELIGRSVVIYETEDKSDGGLTAAVIARSAGVALNCKKLCQCDGSIIWESTVCI
ncbi:copper chaperone for superoxide dismutase, chloroplastic/cytosolic-like [Mercurialis annua]|uniref:copper chaperone for superoxide dismutase, chloroplastic/cytosolic-like n=1 Tax=Mercurialis annua TaxID=3986 RepID=UPI0021601D81|nr:copper chaperone for superoxide dismutase, chloroplastic/cytosolic-like [Mercurialis annua]